MQMVFSAIANEARLISGIAGSGMHVFNGRVEHIISARAVTSGCAPPTPRTSRASCSTRSASSMFDDMIRGLRIAAKSIARHRCRK